ncbi:UL36 very large tegument protein, partial [Streptomyces sp. NPDC058667]
MTAYHIPSEQEAFARWLAELADRIPPGGGWYAVFADRDPEGLRACFDGTEILPWDVVESLLQDAGEPADGPLAVRGRTLYVAATGAHDRRPGAAAALTERRELMDRERRHAESRALELDGRLRATPAPPPEEAARLEHDLAWTRDDHARAMARFEDLTTRLERLGERGPTGQTPWAPPPAAPAPARARAVGAAGPRDPGRAPGAPTPGRAGGGAAGPPGAGPPAGPPA